MMYEKIRETNTLYNVIKNDLSDATGIFSIYNWQDVGEILPFICSKYFFSDLKKGLTFLFISLHFGNKIDKIRSIVQSDGPTE